MGKSVIASITFLSMLIAFLFPATISAESEKKKEDKDMFIIIAQDGFKGEPFVECRMNITEQGRRLVIKSYSGEYEENQLIQTVILSKSGGKGTIISYYNVEKDQPQDSLETYNIFETWCLPYFREEGLAPEEIKEFINLFYDNKPRLKTVLPNPPNSNSAPDVQEKSSAESALKGRFDI